MKNLKYIYQLTLAEKQQFEKLDMEHTNLFNWINNRLQEAFDEGRKHPIEEEK